MDDITGIEFNDALLSEGHGHLNVELGEEDLGDTTEESERYEQVIRELKEFEEAWESPKP